MKHLHFKSTNILYIVLWAIVGLLCLIDSARANISEDGTALLNVGIVCRSLLALMPFFILFVYNNYLLIPKFLLSGQTRKYLAGIAVGLILTGVYQYADFLEHEASMPPKPLPKEGFMPPRRLLPLPMMLDLIYDVLVIGVNTAIALMFQRFDDKLDHERLLKATAENELSYLKAQINPHFYMNMLNNIHGMIEIDPAKAQDLVLDMSRLMRYMLYDSSKPETLLTDEVTFIKTYLSIMRKRYPESRVAISADFPEDESMRRIKLPPLLFLVFIENAFKHGISYRHDSFVSVSLSIEGRRLLFTIMNSCHESDWGASSKGIGISNIRQRLDLIYGNRAQLEISHNTTAFLVQLSFPINETENNHN